MCKSCLECVQKMSLVVCACLLLPLKAALLSPSAALCADGGCCWECHPWGNTPWDTKQWLLAGPGRERKGQRRVRRTRREGARTKAKACGVCVCVYVICLGGFGNCKQSWSWLTMSKIGFGILAGRDESSDAASDWADMGAWILAPLGLQSHI